MLPLITCIFKNIIYSSFPNFFEWNGMTLKNVIFGSISNSYTKEKCIYILPYNPTTEQIAVK